MTPAQYRDALAALGLTQLGAADFLGVDLKTSHNYANGRTKIPEATAKLLRLMRRLGITPARTEQYLAD